MGTDLSSSELLLTMNVTRISEYVLTFLLQTDVVCKTEFIYSVRLNENCCELPSLQIYFD